MSEQPDMERLKVQMQAAQWIDDWMIEHHPRLHSLTLMLDTKGLRWAQGILRFFSGFDIVMDAEMHPAKKGFKKNTLLVTDIITIQRWGKEKATKRFSASRIIQQ